MLTSSKKAKGRNAQKFVRDLLLELYPCLTEDDIRSTSMGAAGADLQLSAAAKQLIGLKFEVKNQERLAGVYSVYDQAVSHQGSEEPVAVLKMNHRKPLALVDLRYFLNLLKEKN